jgi:hypothetical protein
MLSLVACSSPHIKDEAEVSTAASSTPSSGAGQLRQHALGDAKAPLGRWTRHHQLSLTSFPQTRMRNGQRCDPGRRRGRVSNHRNGIPPRDKDDHVNAKLVQPPTRALSRFPLDESCTEIPAECARCAQTTLRSAG